MIDNKARLFVPLPMNPLHRDLDKGSSQIETDLKTSTKIIKGSHHYGIMQNSIPSSSLLHTPSSSIRTRNLHTPQSNPTSNFTIIEVIKPAKQKHDSKPAFAKPYMMQDSSLESATKMNLGPLKASLLQAEEASFSHMASGSGGLQAGPHSILSPSSLKPFQSVSSSYQLLPQSSVINKVKVGFNGLTLTGQQLQAQENKAADDSSSGSETQSTQYFSSDDGNSIPKTPDFPLTLPSSVTKVKVVFWVNELRRYLFLWETGRMSSAHATELHQLLCTIEDKMAHPFLTPQVLGESSLAKVMKSFRHGGYDVRSKGVARRVTRYWRKVCLEA